MADVQNTTDLDAVMDRIDNAKDRSASGDLSVIAYRLVGDLGEARAKLEAKAALPDALDLLAAIANKIAQEQVDLLRQLEDAIKKENWRGCDCIKCIKTEIASIQRYGVGAVRKAIKHDETMLLHFNRELSAARGENPDS